MSTPGTPTPDPSTPAPSLHHPGAVARPGDATAWHFGNPLAEQRAASTSAALLDRSDRELLVVAGAERLSWLEGFVSQHVSELQPGASTQSLVLDANGRVEHHFGLVATPDVVILDTAPGRARELHAFLDRMVFWADAEPRLAPELALLTVVGPGAEPLVRPLLVDEAPRAIPGLRAFRTLPAPAGPGLDIVVERASLQEAWGVLAEAIGAVIGGWGWDALRAERLQPDTADLDEKTIPHEVPSWIGDAASGGAVHLDKGCYRGQETVSRVHNLGRAPRALVRLMFDGSHDELPAPGTPVHAGGRVVGRLGTAVQHHDEGPVALALVKRNLGADIELEVGGVAARIDPESLPDDSGPQAGRDAVSRLRGM